MPTTPSRPLECFLVMWRGTHKVIYVLSRTARALPHAHTGWRGWGLREQQNSIGQRRALNPADTLDTSLYTAAADITHLFTQH